jgi:uncharacterized protein with FMN-binding domain
MKLINTRTLTTAGLGAALLGTGALPATAAAATTKTYKGKVELTQYGPVQVAITVTGKKIKSIALNANPDSQESYQRQDYALPRLRTEALRAQSYKVHTISGVTVTSDGFIASLYSAMGHAHLL